MKINLSLFSSLVLVLIPTTAWAQNTNISVQESSNSAVVVGSGNVVKQNNTQSNIQYNLGTIPNTQQSVQQSRNEAAAIGNNNVILQNSQQHNVQNRFGNNTYRHPYFR